MVMFFPKKRITKSVFLIQLILSPKVHQREEQGAKSRNHQDFIACGIRNKKKMLAGLAPLGWDHQDETVRGSRIHLLAPP